MRNLKQFRPTKIQLLKLLPLVVWLTIILAKFTLGMAGPTFPPPPPIGGSGDG